jgi:hypothetical protein
MLNLTAYNRGLENNIQAVNVCYKINFIQFMQQEFDFSTMKFNQLTEPVKIPLKTTRLPRMLFH